MAESNKLIPGTEIKFDWDEYDVYYNTEYEYLGTYTKYGIVVEFDDTPYQQDLKKKDLIKVCVKSEASKYDTDGKYYYLDKNDKTIVIISKWYKIKQWLRKHFGYKIKIIKL